MRWFFSRGAPPITRILLVESGPRTVAEQVVPRIRRAFGADVPIDLLTCLPTNLESLASGDHAAGRVWRVTECHDTDSRWELLWRIRFQRHPVTAIICADSPVMMPWKLAMVALLPSKFLIVNENADFFWLDRSQIGALKNLLLQRAGLQPDLAVRVLARAVAFPVTLLYLLGYAAWVHSVRLVRLARSSRGNR